MKELIKTSLYLLLFSFPSLAQTIQLNPEGLNDNSKFGYAVAVNTSWAVISATGQAAGSLINAGEVYIYRNVNGSWKLQTTLQPDYNSAFSLFGTSIAIDGNQIVIGSPGDNENGIFCGAAYVYEYLNSSWTRTAKLFPPEVSAMQNFGQSVSIAGNKIVVGSPNANGHTVKSGAAYVFEKLGESWMEVAKLISFDSKTNDMFGYDVAVQKNGTTVVGAPRSFGKSEGSGSAYLFLYDDADYSHPVKLFNVNGTTGDRFGFSVSIDDNRIAIGSHVSSRNSIFPGAVFIYNINAGNLKLEKKLENDSNNDYFGYDVAIRSGYLLVGAPYADMESIDDVGKAALYRFDGTSWIKSNSFHLNGTNKNDYFASSVALDSAYFLIGARLYGLTDKGAVYVQKYNDITGVEESLPKEFSLSQNYPNPFNPSTTIKYSLPVQSKVHLTIYNLLGQEVIQLVSDEQVAGYHEVKWNAYQFASGVYFLRIDADPIDGAYQKFSSVKKMMLIK